MTKPITVNGGGIKCDNQECDFVDDTASIENYADWLNKPCPKCGENLLTQADYNSITAFMELVNLLNADETLQELTDKADESEFIEIGVKFEGDGTFSFIDK